MKLSSSPPVQLAVRCRRLQSSFPQQRLALRRGLPPLWSVFVAALWVVVLLVCPRVTPVVAAKQTAATNEERTYQYQTSTLPVQRSPSPSGSDLSAHGILLPGYRQDASAFKPAYTTTSSGSRSSTSSRNNYQPLRRPPPLARRPSRSPHAQPAPRPPSIDSPPNSRLHFSSTAARLPHDSRPGKHKLSVNTRKGGSVRSDASLSSSASSSAVMSPLHKRLRRSGESTALLLRAQRPLEVDLVAELLKYGDDDDDFIAASNANDRNFASLAREPSALPISQFSLLLHSDTKTRIFASEPPVSSVSEEASTRSPIQPLLTDKDVIENEAENSGQFVPSDKRERPHSSASNSMHGKHPHSHSAVLLRDNSATAGKEESGSTAGDTLAHSQLMGESSFSRPKISSYPDVKMSSLPMVQREEKVESTQAIAVAGGMKRSKSAWAILENFRPAQLYVIPDEEPVPEDWHHASNAPLLPNDINAQPTSPVGSAAVNNGQRGPSFIRSFDRHSSRRQSRNPSQNPTPLSSLTSSRTQESNLNNERSIVANLAAIVDRDHSDSVPFRSRPHHHRPPSAPPKRMAGVATFSGTPVEPKHILGIPFRCEKMCAKNSARCHDALAEDSLPKVAFYYLQARHGRRREIWKSIGLSLVPIAGWIGMAPTVQNARTYGRRKRELAATLETRMHAQDWTALRKLRFNRNVGTHLIAFFDQHPEYQPSSSTCWREWLQRKQREFEKNRSECSKYFDCLG